MNLIAAVVLIVVLGVSLWSWRLAPGRQMAEQFTAIWNVKPWGKQFFFDFFGLNVMLALWMVSDAATRGSWGAATACIVGMPFFGAMAAAVYWLIR